MGLIDQNRLNAEYAGDEEILREIISVYFTESVNMIARLNDSIQKLDAKQIEHHAHTLKGAVSNFYAPEVKDVAFKLEVAGRENNLASAAEDFSKLRSLLQQLDLELKAIAKL